MNADDVAAGRVSQSLPMASSRHRRTCPAACRAQGQAPRGTSGLCRMRSASLVQSAGLPVTRCAAMAQARRTPASLSLTIFFTNGIVEPALAARMVMRIRVIVLQRKVDVFLLGTLDAGEQVKGAGANSLVVTFPKLKQCAAALAPTLWSCCHAT